MDRDSPTDRRLALGALLLVITAFWLPWWVVRLHQNGATTSTGFQLFRPFEPVTTSWAPHVTGLLLVVVALSLAIRLTGRSWYHEPATWVRTLGGSAATLALTNLLLVAWPNSIPHAWGRRSLRDNVTMDVVASEVAMPGLGWWLVLVAAGCLGAAWWLARQNLHPGDESDAVGDTSDK